jgi:hypothetical protein
MLKSISILAIVCAPQIAAASAPTTWPKQWKDNVTTLSPVHHHRHHFARRSPKPDKAILKLRADLASLRRELDEVRARVSPIRWGEGIRIPAGLDVAIEVPVTGQGVALSLLASLPDLRLPDQTPAQPVPLPASQDTPVAVDKARAYLVATATPGFTMARQGPDVAIGRLHPAFAVRLAQAVREARSEGMSHAGVFSAYRPPAFGVGGFSDKFNSLHSYGLAADVIGIGSPGSRAARLWQKIVQATGLFLPYGPNNRAEFNHTQAIPSKIAPSGLHRTITASGPKDNEAMWRASGVKAPEPSDEPSVTEASNHIRDAVEMLEHHKRR